MRRFQLHRDNDVTGISGTGVVAEGVEFTPGECVVRWLTETWSCVFYLSKEDVIKIHGHNGSTRLVWLD